jgi:hypothetical protein
MLPVKRGELKERGVSENLVKASMIVLPRLRLLIRETNARAKQESERITQNRLTGMSALRVSIGPRDMPYCFVSCLIRLPLRTATVYMVAKISAESKHVRKHFQKVCDYAGKVQGRIVECK